MANRCFKAIHRNDFKQYGYAEPVAYGQNLPPSWGGQYRTRQATVKGYPEIIGKELENWARGEYEKIKRGI